MDKHRILLVEDDFDDIDFFEGALHSVQPDAELSCTASGKSLMSKLEGISKNLPDLIFLDLNLPGINGMDCLSAIREIDSLNGLPIIIYSASDKRRDIDESYDKGANIFFAKTYDYVDLKKILKGILEINWLNYPRLGTRSNYVFSA